MTDTALQYLSREQQEIMAKSLRSSVEIIAEGRGWQPIETAPRGRKVLLYFARETGRNPLEEMIKHDSYPVSYPRQPTHWMPLPPPPTPPSPQ